MDISSLLKKYNVAAPRYTSYPTVPFWDTQNWNEQGWINTVKKSYSEHKNEGISLYIHLPFCESLCTYCGCNTRITKNHEVEIPYIHAVLEEWKMYRSMLGATPHIREIHLGGGTPTFFSAKNLELLLKGILDDTMVLPDAEFSFEAHPANTTIQHLETLYQLGFKRLSLGIQDFNPKVQLMINRWQTLEQVAEITQVARNIGYNSINFDLIYGLPLQNQQCIQETLNQVVQMQPDRIAFYSYAHVPWLKPGQRLYTEAHLPSQDEKFELYQTGRDFFINAGYINIGMDHFALKHDSLYQASVSNNLHRNFMGYTHQHTKLLIGLGVSSISDSWYGFAQNVKKVEQYLKCIAENSLPLEKGHVLTDEDLKTRKHILNLMCSGKTFYPASEPISDEIIERLTPLIADNLINLTQEDLIVSELGKSFLRNICMALDQRLWKNEHQSNLFSMAI